MSKPLAWAICQMPLPLHVPLSACFRPMRGGGTIIIPNADRPAQRTNSLIQCFVGASPTVAWLQLPMDAFRHHACSSAISRAPKGSVSARIRRTRVAPAGQDVPIPAEFRLTPTRIQRPLTHLRGCGQICPRFNPKRGRYSPRRGTAQDAIQHGALPHDRPSSAIAPNRRHSRAIHKPLRSRCRSCCTAAAPLICAACDILYCLSAGTFTHLMCSI